MLHDDLGFFLIQLGKFRARSSLNAEQLVELGVDSLRVAMLGSLNEQCHEPSADGRHRLPIEALRIENQPRSDIQKKDDECGRMRCQDAEARESGMPDIGSSSCLSVHRLAKAFSTLLRKRSKLSGGDLSIL
jgi:hypothetical protein